MEVKTQTPSVLPCGLDQIYFNVEQIWGKRAKETGDCLTVSTILETITMRHSTKVSNPNKFNDCLTVTIKA